MRYTTVDRERFLEMRWLVYENNVNNKEKIAKDHNVPVDCVEVMEPPMDDEIICDSCNREVVSRTLFLTEDQTRLHCRQCVSKYAEETQAL